MRITLAVAVILMAGAAALHLIEPVRGQNPTPPSFLRNTSPGFTEPNDGASVLVVEGLGAGVCGFDYSLDLIVYITVTAINSGRRVITEISPQRYNGTGGTPVCLSTVQDWNNVTLELIARVVQDAPNYGTYWGGVMVDEEDGFWQPYSNSVAAYTAINQGLHQQMVLLAPNGISWYYTENFASQGSWTFSDYYNITYLSIPAPQVANSNMVNIANFLVNVEPTREILVTWSQEFPYQYNMYESTSLVNGNPYSEWGLSLSNCFTISLPCNDFDEDYITNPLDNCVYFANGGQENSDANYIDMPPSYSTDDLTWVNSGVAGDACDSDDDNDGREDSFEASGCAGSGATSRTERDTDGDRVLDGAECLLGTNATDPSSKPPLTSCGSSADSDNDKIADRLEFCFYNSLSGSTDTDLDKFVDGARDGCEIASFNGDRIVNVGDIGILSQAIAGILPYHVNVDVNKDGVLNIGDKGTVSLVISQGLCPSG